MNEERLRRLHVRLLERRSPSDRGGCPPPEDLLAIAERRLPEARRLAVLDHVGGCGPCREELDLLRSVVEEGHRLAPRRPPWLALAASLALVIGAGVVWRAVQGGRESVVRGGDAEVALIAPRSGRQLDQPPTLAWHAVEGARSYRLELLDAEGGVLLSLDTADTTAGLADRVGLRAGSEYRWWVRAQLATGERRSPIWRFRTR